MRTLDHILCSSCGERILISKWSDEERLMLTEEGKTRIRNEEIFRTEVRRELEVNKSRSRRERLWTLLNSSFALWFLSSIVLASLTTALTYYQAERSEQLRKTEIERRLDTEISSRITLAQRGALLDGERVAQHNEYPPASIYQNVQSYLDNSFTTGSSNRLDFSIYPEYEKRTFRSLVFELRSVADPSARSELTAVLAVYERLLDLGSQPGKGEIATQQTVESALKLLDQLTKRRWLPPQGVPEAAS